MDKGLKGTRPSSKELCGERGSSTGRKAAGARASELQIPEIFTRMTPPELRCLIQPRYCDMLSIGSSWRPFGNYGYQLHPYLHSEKYVCVRAEDAGGPKAGEALSVRELLPSSEVLYESRNPEDQENDDQDPDDPHADHHHPTATAHVIAIHFHDYSSRYRL